MQQEVEIPNIKLQSMVYQLMRLCEKLEAHGDRGIQRDLELKETIENLNETINDLDQVGPVLEDSVKKITQITVNNFLEKIRNHILLDISNACYKLSQEANCNGSLSKTPRLANSDLIWLKLIANENYLRLTLIANEKNWL